MKACVDIGGTKVAVSLAPSENTASPSGIALQHRRAEPTAKTGAPDVLARQILRLLGEACASAGATVHDIEAVGVSSCGPFVHKAGMIELAAPNICGGIAGPARGLPNDWTSAVLEAPLRAQFSNLWIENDGIAALQGIDHCAYITWSTGIGCGLCVDGHVLRGKQGNAGHAGHLFVSDNFDALCGCGNIGDVEALVAGNAMARRFGPRGYADAARLLQAAQDGELAATAIVDEVCRVMGRALYNLIVTLDLQRISLGGSVFWHHRDYLLPRLRPHISGKLAALTDGCDLVAAGLGERVGDYSALALINQSCYKSNS